MALESNTAGIQVNALVSPQQPVSFTGIAVTADVAWHSPANMVDVVPIASNTKGIRLTKVYAIARAALGGATNAVLYKRIGSTYTLIDSVLMADNTPTLAVANGKGDFGISETNPLILNANEGLAFAIGRTVANGVVCRAEGGAYV